MNDIKTRLIIKNEWPENLALGILRERIEGATCTAAARSEITMQHADERSPDCGAGDIKHETSKPGRPNVEIGSTRTHPFSLFTRAGPPSFVADEIQLGSGHSSGVSRAVPT